MRLKIRYVAWFGSLIVAIFWYKSLHANDCSLEKPTKPAKANTAASNGGSGSGDTFDVYGQRRVEASASTEAAVNESAPVPRSQYYYNHNMPLVFIGGVPGAGLTLMRAIVDAHPAIRCGEDTNLITNIVLRRQEWTGSKIEKERLFHAGMHDHVMNAAVRAFILELIVKQGKTAPVLCNKDPLVLMHAGYVRELFPAAKFVWVVRDARANAYQLVLTGTPVPGYQTSNHEQAIQAWNKVTEQQYARCKELGPAVCLMVRYEQLVLEPERVTREICAFLNVTWSERMLHHERHLDGITLSNVKVEEPLNSKSLYAWLNKVQSYVLNQIDKNAPMMAKLGYDAFNMPPNYASMFSRPSASDAAAQVPVSPAVAAASNRSGDF